MKFNAAVSFYCKTVNSTPIRLCNPSLRRLNHYGRISSLHEDEGTFYTVFRHFTWKIPFISSSSSNTTTSSAPCSSCRPSNETTTSQRFSAKETDLKSKFMDERLAGACLDLLKLCGNSGSVWRARKPLDRASKERLWKVTDMLLHESQLTPADQFDIVYDALCCPAARKEMQMRRILMVVLESVLPMDVFRLFEAEDLILPEVPDVHDAKNVALRSMLRRFIHSFLGELDAPDGLTKEEVLRAYTEDFKHAFPTAALSPAFVELEKKAMRIAMRAKLIKLLMDLYAAFDTQRTGKVKLIELRHTVEQVMGKEKARQLLEDIPTDSEGNLAYAQFTWLLARLTSLRKSDNLNK
ncbi:unnamed protein product [Phytomonas sp. EM1]|nr:unnamed protein product [Phytomonas sp. EM1]|eukprot:CCW62550.1 unnamed protein product [Phytomonas sp. isolate EM1]